MPQGTRARDARRAAAFLLGIAGLLAACAWLAGSDRTWKPPAGWQLWTEVGPVRAVALLGNDVYVGGPMGLFRLSEGSTERVRGQSGALVNALSVGTDGSLWVGHRDGLLRLGNDEWQEVTQADGLPGREVLATALARSGGIWAGTTGGVARVSPSHDGMPAVVEVVGAAEGLPSPRVTAIAEDEAGALWLGASGAPMGGLCRWSGGRWYHWTPADGLPHADVVSLLQDAGGNIWAGCGRLDRGGAATLPCEGPAWDMGRPMPLCRLTGAKVRSLFQDSRGLIWLGTEYAGLTVMRDDGTIGSVTICEALPHPEVMDMAEGPDGAIWLGTGAGLVRLDRRAAEGLVASLRGDGRGG